MAEQKNPTTSTIDEETGIFCKDSIFACFTSIMTVLMNQKDINKTLLSKGLEKTTWPELVGLTADEAEKKIKEDMPLARTFVLPQGSPFTCDYRLERVHIFVDSAGKVDEAPHIG